MPPVEVEAVRPAVEAGFPLWLAISLFVVLCGPVLLVVWKMHAMMQDTIDKLEARDRRRAQDAA